MSASSSTTRRRAPLLAVLMARASRPGAGPAAGWHWDGKTALDRAQRLDAIVQLLDAPLAVAQLLRLPVAVVLDAALLDW